jgi:hypothetical protein
MRKTLEEYRQANRIKKMNYELLNHLQGVYYWIFKYSEQNNIPIPKKNQLLRMAEKADFLIGEIESDQPKGNTNNNNLEGNRIVNRHL